MNMGSAPFNEYLIFGVIVVAVCLFTDVGLLGFFVLFFIILFIYSLIFF